MPFVYDICTCNTKLQLYAKEEGEAQNSSGKNVSCFLAEMLFSTHTFQSLLVFLPNVKSPFVDNSRTEPTTCTFSTEKYHFLCLINARIQVLSEGYNFECCFVS